MPLPTPSEGEGENEFISRCVSEMIEVEDDLDEDSDEDRQQAVAICYLQWREAQEKSGSESMEHKTFPGIVTKTNEDEGIVEAVFAVFGNVDAGKDIVHPGAFAKTFAERGHKVRVLDHHNASSLRDVIGKPLELRELPESELPMGLKEQYPDATGGAYARVQFLVDTPEGKGAFIRLRDGAVDEWSFGYDALDKDYSTIERNGDEMTVRNLRTLKLYEISPVIWGMNEATMTTVAKELKAGSITDMIDRIREAFESQFPAPESSSTDYWVEEIYSDYVLVGVYDESEFPIYRVGYEMTEDEVIFDQRDEWVGGAMVFQSGAKTRALHRKTKAGRVPAQRNADRLEAAVVGIIDVLNDAGYMVEIPGYTPDERIVDVDETDLGAPPGGAAQQENDGDAKRAGPRNAPTPSVTPDEIVQELIELELMEV